MYVFYVVLEKKIKFRLEIQLFFCPVMSLFDEDGGFSKPKGYDIINYNSVIILII
jgi:hypothetical protein